jgi:hypothetical protein
MSLGVSINNLNLKQTTTTTTTSLQQKCEAKTTTMSEVQTATSQSSFTTNVLPQHDRKKTSRLRGRFNDAKKLDSAVDFVQSATADQKLPNGPTPPVRMGAPPSVGGFSETFVTSIFSQAIVSLDGTNNNNKVDEQEQQRARLHVHVGVHNIHVPGDRADTTGNKK